MTRHEPTTTEVECHIREWFERHQDDYCPHHDAPPLVWAEYFRWLLDELHKCRIALQKQKETA